jgi:FixJ family two-component response regulator
MTSAPIVHVVDDSDSVRRALARLLRATGYEVREYESAEALLAASLEADGPAMVLADLVLPGLDGLSLAARLGQTQASPPVVFLSARGAVSSSVQAMKQGAIDFLEKPADEKDVLGAVARAIEHSRERIEERRRLADLRRRYQTLTSREREVLALVVAGLLNKQVASELSVTEKTVKVHRARAVRKMGAQSLPALVRMAVRLGITDTSGPNQPVSDQAIPGNSQGHG